MTVLLPLNELSFEGIGATGDDADLLRRLTDTLVVLRSSTVVSDRHQLRAVAPDDLWSCQLPFGAVFSNAVQQLRRRSRDHAERLVEILTTGLSYDEGGRVSGIEQVSGRVRHGDRWGRGFYAAVCSAGVVISIDHAPFQTTQLEAVHVTATAEMADSVENCWTADLQLSQRSALSLHVQILPQYSDPGHHDPGSSNYRHGKSHIPASARRLLARAVSGPGEWWAICEHGFYHRFQGSNIGGREVVHWNGSTNPNALQTIQIDNVSADVKNRLQDYVVRGCGCRDV